MKKNGRLLVVIDEARASSKEEAGRLRDWLEVFANEARRLSTHYRDRLGGRLSFIVLTSDALAADVWLKVGSKVGWALMWNLPRDAFERLADQLGISIDRDLLWNLTGGNSRALGDIAGADLHTWLRSIIKKVKLSIWNYVDDLTRHGFTGSQIWEHISGSAKEPLGYIAYPLAKRFLEDNIAIMILETPISELPSMPTIGRMNAYQIPAYYYTLRAIAKKDASILSKIMEAEIVPEEVIEEAKKIISAEK